MAEYAERRLWLAVFLDAVNDAGKVRALTPEHKQFSKHKCMVVSSKTLWLAEIIEAREYILGDGLDIVTDIYYLNKEFMKRRVQELISKAEAVEETPTLAGLKDLEEFTERFRSLGRLQELQRKLEDVDLDILCIECAEGAEYTKESKKLPALRNARAAIIVEIREIKGE